ncbi:MAG TPA: NAD(P)H-hydrate dehydratase [Caulobacteraceae bacterium]|nr:NAD(P)H-hydrate dehydratase [Caulobacteraceae bacterium]
MTHGREILTVEEIRTADAAAVAAGTPGIVLMERAGAAVVEAIARRFTPRPAVVLCGPGNNGGDGYVVARLLAERGWSVRVEALGPPTAADAVEAARRWTGETGPIGQAAPDEALIVDALFGAGLSRPLEGEAARAAALCAPLRERIVAVDVPSGLDGDTGKPVGLSFEAALTVTFHRKKPAHVLVPGRGLCGEVAVADIGLGPIEGRLFENGPELWLHGYPWPATDAHKHSRGRLGVVSGKVYDTGAARLATRAGLRTAGTVRLYCPPEAAAINAAHLEAAMLKPFETDLELEQLAGVMDAMVIGPAAGVDDQTRHNLLAVARTGAAMVVDADALTVFRDDPRELFAVLDRDDVLTPHTGEFERVFPGLLKSAPDKVSAARAAAEKAGAVVVLKGPDTVVAAPDGRAVVNTNATPWLATAGSGDVLAGVIGGLAAGAMDSFDAACAGVWMHAEAGRLFGPGLTAEDLPGMLPAVIRELWSRR